MDIRTLIEEIDSIRQIAETWKETDKTPEIEKGIVLDKLKKLYEMLLLPPQPTPTVAETECAIRAAEDTAAPAAVPIPTEEPVIGNEIVPETVNVPPIVEPTAPPVAEIETTVSVEQQLFGDEQTVRPRMDKQVILSLYGDAPTQPTHPHNPTPQARSYEAPHPAPPVAAPEPAGQNGPASDTAAHKKVLGETFANGNGVAMNEVLGKQTAHADVASKLQSQSISGDLRQCIGINDRFMLIRSLFNGNADQYASAACIEPLRMQQLIDLEQVLGCTVKRNKTLLDLCKTGRPYAAIDEQLRVLSSQEYYDLPVIMPSREKWILPAGAFAKK